MKDIILHLLSKYGVAVGTGYVMEFYGEAIHAMDMEERMTLCNMAIEGEQRLALLHQMKNGCLRKGRKYAPKDYESIKKNGQNFIQI